MRVFVYPEKTREELGAERYDLQWEKIRASALSRNRMVEMNAKGKHARDKHEGEFEKCEIRDCLHARLIEIDPDSDIDTYHLYFRGPDAKERAMEKARKILAEDKTAFGCVELTRQVVEWFVEEDGIAEWSNVGDGEVIDE